jgi:plasmid maintenance system antidote protein VapI
MRPADSACPGSRFRVFCTASTARAWLAMQVNFDLAQAMQREQPDVQPLDDKAA